MRRCLAAWILTAMIAPAAAQNPSDSLERDFRAGGAVRMDLGAGGYEIRGTTEDRIRVRWSTKRPEQMKNVRVQVDVRGSEATIETDGPRSDCEVTIEVPARTGLHVRLSAGELKIRGIEGNKDVETHAGELDIDVGRADDYGRVDASVSVGELEASAFRTSKGGLFWSFKWDGPGRYRLHAHVGAGEVRLRSDGR